MSGMIGLIEPLRYALLLSLLCCCWWGCWLTARFGSACWGQVSRMRFIYLHLHINPPNWRLGICRNCHFIAIQGVVWVYCWLDVLYMKNANFYCQVGTECVCVCVCAGDRKREYLPPNWYDVWHFIYCSWPVRLIMLPKAIRANRTYAAHAHVHVQACTHTWTHSL